MKRSHPLDPHLALLHPEPEDDLAELPVLEVSEVATLVAIARDLRLTRFLLGRLSDTTALVDPGREDDLLAALRSAGHTPKLVGGGRS